MLVAEQQFERSTRAGTPKTEGQAPRSPQPALDLSAIALVHPGPDHNAVIQRQRLRVGHPADSRPSSRAIVSTVLLGATAVSSEDRIARIVPPTAKLPPVAVRSAPNRNTEHASNRNHVKRRLTGVEMLADIRHCDVRHRQIQVRDRGDQGSATLKPTPHASACGRHCWSRRGRRPVCRWLSLIYVSGHAVAAPLIRG